MGGNRSALLNYLCTKVVELTEAERYEAALSRNTQINRLIGYSLRKEQ